jgi:N-acetylmuramic acid 6-phosphate etherase
MPDDGPAMPDDGLWSTEAANPRTTALDTLGTRGVVDALLAEEASVAAAVQAEAPAIARAADRVADALAAGGRLVYVGAGTSGRLGVADAAECPPTFGTDPGRILARIAGGPDAVFRAQEGAEDDASAGAAAVRELRLGPRDVVVGISASGRTPYVLGALAAARDVHATTVLVTAAAAAGRAVADVCIGPDTGPEALAGSTRLKAATAAKMVLATLSTAAMVRLGKVYGNLMVDLSPTCGKLRDRARRILRAVAGVDGATADRLMGAAGGRANVAAVMARCGLDSAAARARLEAAGGRLRAALGEAAP